MAQVNRLTMSDMDRLERHSEERTAEEWSRRLDGRASESMLRKLAKAKGWRFKGSRRALPTA